MFPLSKKNNNKISSYKYYKYWQFLCQAFNYWWLILQQLIKVIFFKHCGYMNDICLQAASNHLLFLVKFSKIRKLFCGKTNERTWCLQDKRHYAHCISRILCCSVTKWKLLNSNKLMNWLSDVVALHHYIGEYKMYLCYCVFTYSPAECFTLS